MTARAVLLAGIAAALPVVAGQAASPVLARPAARFSPPAGPMLLSRTVIRELSGGKQIVVKRSYRVQFVAVAGGYQLEGQQVAVSVDVPPVLAGLADLERKRVDPGPFPVAVDNFGLMHAPQAAKDTGAAMRRSAGDAAAGIVRANHPDAKVGDEAIRVLGVMARDPHSSPWPIDLFTASEGERHQHRSVTLSDGRVGDVDVVLRVGKHWPCGLPTEFERVITTVLGGATKVSREIWSLEAVSGP